MEIAKFIRPRAIDEAFIAVRDQKGFPIGGGGWSRMNSRKIPLAVDLSGLGLRFIRRKGETIEIGAMSTARDIETSDDLRESFGPFFSSTVAHIVGVQLKNMVTLGGTVAGRYGFSDLNTSLLALGARVVLYQDGIYDFETFLNNRKNGPFLLEKVILPADTCRASFQSVRNTRNDFPILNAAASFQSNEWRIAVGARPGAARLAVRAAEMLGGISVPESDLIEHAAEAAANELVFGDDLRADADYRRAVCRTLVSRAVQEAGK